MNVTLTLATRYGLNILGLLGVSVALYLGSSIFIPLTISGLLAAILYPAATWLHTHIKLPWVFANGPGLKLSSGIWLDVRTNLPWFFACLGVILLICMILAALFLAVAVSVPQIIDRLPNNEAKWQDEYEKMARRVREVSPFMVEGALPLKAEGSPFYQSVRNLFAPENIAASLKDLGLVTVQKASQMMMILFIILFLLLEGEMLAKKVRAIFGTSEESNRRVTEAIAQMAEAIRTYLVWRTIINMLLGLFVGLVYKAAGLDQWYLWAVMTAVLNYVPYIGTIAAGIPPVAEALITGRPELAIFIILGYTLIVTFEGYWIVPRVMGKTMDLNATTVMVSCLYWNLVWGIAGLFLAMPLMAAVKAILTHVEGWQTWGDLLSSVDTTPAAPPNEAGIRLAEIAQKADNDSKATAVLETPLEPAPPTPALR